MGNLVAPDLNTDPSRNDSHLGLPTKRRIHRYTQRIATFFRNSINQNSTLRNNQSHNTNVNTRHKSNQDVSLTGEALVRSSNHLINSTSQQHLLNGSLHNSTNISNNNHINTSNNNLNHSRNARSNNHHAKSRSCFESCIGGNGISNSDISNFNNNNNNNGPINESHQNMICLHDFMSKHDSDLSARKGDRIIVFDINDPDWWLAEHLTTKQRGYIPKNYVASQAIETEEWFFSKISRRESEKLLLAEDIARGTFIVRNTDKHTGYCLSIRDRDQQTPVKHYKIKTMDNGRYFISQMHTFLSVAELIAFYSNSRNGLCCTLLRPCPKPKLSFWPGRSNEINRSELQLKRKIGTGYFGEVYYGTYRNVAVAVKTLKQGTMSPQAFLEEAIIMRKCRHEKLVPLYGVCSQGEPLLIITEFMCNGSLLDYLRNNRDSKNLKLPDLMDIAAQIADGMSYLEKMKLVHRDLAARNILVGENNTVKVADFGLARVLEDTYVAKHGSKFPVKWCALESALYGRFSEKSDVWSFGIVLFEIVTYGQIPYAGMQNKEVIDRIQTGYRMAKPTNFDCPDAVYNIMLECWQSIPDKRPTFEFLATFFENFSVSAEQSYRDAVDCF